MPLSEDENNLISLFRGINTPQSKLKKRNTKGLIESFESICERVIKRYKVKENDAESEIKQAWKFIMHGEFSKLTSPSYIKNNILFVNCENPLVRQNLHFEKREILKNINCLPHCSNIKDVKFL